MKRTACKLEPFVQLSRLILHLLRVLKAALQNALLSALFMSILQPMAAVCGTKTCVVKGSWLFDNICIAICNLEVKVFVIKLTIRFS